MKIKSIRFLNLNSLRGEHEICFDAPPLSDSGLFAITGPTGAGKTTILDAITLGLYGRVNRHDRDLPSEIMTRHTAEAFSEVTFEARNEVYRAKWSVYRSRKKADGNLQPIKMELCRVSDEVIFDLKSHEVPGKISELCGLDYNQFLRSVMLSQGEFTRFLKANENERSELLERITDTAIYSDISRQAYRRAAAEKNALNQLRSELSGQALLAPELLTEYETSLESLRQQETLLKTSRTETENQLTWLKNLQKLSEKKEQTQRALVELEENAGRYKTEFERLEQHKIAVTFRPELVKLEREEKLLTDLQTQQEKLTLQIPELKAQSETAQKQATAAKAGQEAAEKTLKEITPLLDSVLQKDSELESLRRQFQKNKEAYQSAKNVFDTGVAEVETHRKTVAQLIQNLADLQHWLQEHAAEKELSSELPVFERYLKDLQEIIADGQKWKKEKTSATEIIQGTKLQLQTSEEKLAALQHQKQELEVALAENQTILDAALAGTSEPELENALQELPHQMNQLEKLRQLALQFGTVAEKSEKLQEQKTLAANGLKTLETTLAELLEKHTAAREILKQYQEILEFQLQVQHYEEARQQLKPDCECPLCGSLEHPFAQNLTPKLTDATEKRNAQQKTVADLEQKRSQAASELAVIQANLKTAENALQENEQLQTALQTEFSEINQQLQNQFSIADAAAISTEIPGKQEELQAKKQKLEKVRQARNQAQVLTEKQYRLQNEMVSQTAIKEQASERKQHAEQTLQKAEAELLDLQEQYTNIAAEAASFTMRFGFTFSAEKGSVLLQELKQQAQTYAQQTEALQQTQLRLTEAEGKLQKTEATQQQKQTQLDALQQQLRVEHQELQDLKTEREKLFGQKNPLEERALLTKACETKAKEAEDAQNAARNLLEKLNLTETQLARLNQDATLIQETVQQLQSELETKLAAQKIISVAALKQLFLADEEAVRLTNLQTQLEKLLTETRQTLADTIAELKTEETKNLTSETVAFLTEKLLQTDHEISEANQQIGSITQILKREKELQGKHQELAQRISKQQKEAERWERLSELIGSESGKKFSKFAQGLTLAKLVMLANRHLLKLNDRYLLQKAPNSDLELQMIDTYQADAVRSVNTLSGGESFLVSLALALGLSDLASHKTQIDSLFIDEGFGTLDAETLDIAITALENLQASGKMIGIISHVEALKERISTQIQVKKLSGGVSKIEVSAYTYDAVFA
ncbi:SbcC/MukB-like Walker B domain-containing protein [Adhaeribacter soli]|uniref:ATP-binding cassette family protein n=1 Tax=Adhaeribacter soli TaxID=2607655 RepID=A0A5N1J1Y7_9BACT|nr:SbcC/MukB-like Walker B domain-containing protein [Adhaeribacter soli]KAA9340532.1 ATP-binding cassette family protein [Adhaeribacter soli]